MVTFKVMTWNVENFFKPDATDAAAQKVYSSKLQLIATVVQGINPDVVAFQELGGEEPLKDLEIQLAQFKGGRAISAHPDTRGICVGFLSKPDLVQKAEQIVDFPAGQRLEVPAAGGGLISRMSRGALAIRVLVGTQEVDLITAHLKSKLLTFPGNGNRFFTNNETERARVGAYALMLRTSEAATLRIHATPLAGARPLIVLGDLNDSPDAATSMLLEGPPSTPVGTAAFHRRPKLDEQRLYNLAPLMDEGENYSRIHHGRRELIDQIFASSALFPPLAGNKRLLPLVRAEVNFSGNLSSITDDPTVRLSEIKPDHAPVIATLQI